MRSSANGWAIIPGDVDDRHRNVRFFETVPQLDTRNTAQVDVENDANHPVEIAVICEGFRRGKQQAFVAQLSQQSRYAPQHHRVVIHDKNKVPLWQSRHLNVENPSWVECNAVSLAAALDLDHGAPVLTPGPRDIATHALKMGERRLRRVHGIVS